MTRKFYAAQSPRGFANETNVHVFSTRAARDQWVADHKDDGDVNSASQGGYAITSAQARKILGERGDAVTANYSASVAH
jgi:hypothetical protein